MLAALRDDIRLNPALFARVKAVWEARATLKLDPDQGKLLEDTWKGFVRGGALLAEGRPGAPAGDQRRAVHPRRQVRRQPAARHQRLPAGDRERRTTSRASPTAWSRAAPRRRRRRASRASGSFTLQAPSIWPFLQYADNRELRRQILTAYTTRSDHGDETDNKATLARIAALRAERAQLLGYKTHADFVLDENMAKTPARVYELLDQLWAPAKAMAAREAADLQAAIRADGKDFTLEPWDWRTTRRRCARRGSTSTSRRCGPTSRSTTCARAPSTWRTGSTASRSPRPDGLPVYNPEVQGVRGEGRRRLAPRASSTPTTTRARASASARGRAASAAPGWRRASGPPRRRQRLQLLPPGGRRAGAAVARGGGDALPRVRPRAELAAVEGPLPRPRRRPRATSSSCRRRSWRTGPPSPRCCSSTRSTTRPAR